MLVSCSEKKADTIKKPDNLIPKEKMILILVDVHLVEGTLSSVSKNELNTQDYSLYYYKSIFAKHKINKEQFDLSIKYYSHYPEKLNEIYTEVVNRLIEIQSRVNVGK